MKKEIERKFLIKNIPKEIISSSIKKRIKQGYIITSDDTEVRVRLIDSESFLTIKVGNGLVREETEIPIHIKEFNTLWAHTKGRRIVKNRYDYIYKNYKIEIDKYLDNNRGLMVAEIEFKSERSSNAFIPPSWFDEEITGRSEYKNQKLAK